MNFWDIHGIWFIFFMFLFPRLTMLFTGIFMAFMSPLFFIGWLIVPRLTVAILASMIYFETNPVLCVLAWFWAFSGEFKEKTVVYKIKH
jgi:hypothetical protein